jgi:uncharacterized membrane protein (UPF0127 family)
MQQTYYAFNKTRESFLGLNIMSPRTLFGRLRGLLGRLRIGLGEGLWLTPSSGIHTIGMLFPIDVIYLDADHRVIHLVEHLRPFRISPIRLRSSSLLQLPAHTIYASQTKLGDGMLICPPQELETYLTNANRLASEQASHEATG